MNRGIAPEILYQHIENTVPFLFTGLAPSAPYSDFVREKRGEKKFNHYQYFELCLCAHYTTVASFVPTDVDNQIRKNLWNTGPETTAPMAELVLKSRAWDFRPWTARYQEGLDNTLGAMVSGHQGEWFSVAVGAYAAHRNHSPELAKTVKNEILAELELESRIFASLKLAGDGIGLLRASTAIAHNLGDLDRVIDQWELPQEDPLRQIAYKLGHAQNAQFGAKQEELLEAGALNKAFMASENHRHYPLRQAKCLRRSIDLFFPLGPFTDAWGETIARHPKLEPREIAEVAEALLEGFQKLSSPKIPLYGYARALAGIQRAFPGGSKLLVEYMRSKSAKSLKLPILQEINQLSPNAFQAQWAKKALNFLKLA
jgi:hypothetical protein